jgi:hypothetical protein
MGFMTWRPSGKLRVRHSPYVTETAAALPPHRATSRLQPLDTSLQFGASDIAFSPYKL